MDGIPVPYVPSNDSLVLSLLIISLFNLSYAFFKSGVVILQIAKSLFYYAAQSNDGNSRLRLDSITNILLNANFAIILSFITLKSEETLDSIPLVNIIISLEKVFKISNSFSM